MRIHLNISPEEHEKDVEFPCPECGKAVKATVLTNTPARIVALEIDSEETRIVRDDGGKVTGAVKVPATATAWLQ